MEDRINHITQTTAENSPEAQLQEEQLISSEISETQTAIQTKKHMSGFKKAMDIMGNIAFACLLLVMVALVYSMVQSRLTGGPPQVAGHQMYIVLGGSMSPTFEAGSLAFLKPVIPQNIVEGDIITYRPPSGEGTLTTHRVMQVNREGDLNFTTRGDANDVNDQQPVMAANVVGKVEFAIPYAGFVMSFGQSKTGILSLVIIPGILIIFFELRNLFRYASEWEAEKAAKKKRESIIVSDNSELHS